MATISFEILNTAYALLGIGVEVTCDDVYDVCPEVVGEEVWDMVPDVCCGVVAKEVVVMVTGSTVVDENFVVSDSTALVFLVKPPAGNTYRS